MATKVETKDFEWHCPVDGGCLKPDDTDEEMVGCDLCGRQCQSDGHVSCNTCTTEACGECATTAGTIKLLRHHDGTWVPIVTDAQLTQRPQFWIRFHAMYARSLFRDVVVQCLTGGAAIEWDTFKNHVFVASVVAGDHDMAMVLLRGQASCGGGHPVFEAVAQRTGALPGNDALVDPSTNDNAPVRWAAQFGRIACLKLLLGDDRVDPGAADNDAVRKVSRHGHSDCLRVLLLDQRVDPSAHTNDAVWLAARHGHLSCLQLLLNDQRVDPGARYNTVIQVAVSNNHPECLRALLKDNRVDPHANHHQALKIAANSGHLECLKVFLEDDRIDPSVWDNYAIREAASYGHLDCVKLLLQDTRVDPTASNHYAVRLASHHGHLDCVSLLLNDERVDPCGALNANFMGALCGGDLARVQAFLVDERAKCDSAIAQLSFYGHTDCLEVLLKDSRFDPAARNNLAVREASYYGHTECLELLLSDGRADPSVKDNAAIREACFARGRDNTDCIALLLDDPRVDPSACNNEAITLAAKRQRSGVVKMLAEDERVQGDLGVLRDMADEKEICDILLRKGDTLTAVMFAKSGPEEGSVVVEENLMNIVNLHHGESRAVGLLCMGEYLNEDFEREILGHFGGLVHKVVAVEEIVVE